MKVRILLGSMFIGSLRARARAERSEASRRLRNLADSPRPASAQAQSLEAPERQRPALETSSAPE